MLVLSCPNGTIYDDERVQCLPSGEASPCNGELALDSLYRRLGDNSLPPIRINSTEPLCPHEGYFAAAPGGCSSKFIKCQESPARNYTVEGYMYQCPDGFAFWPVSQRCERSGKLQGCQGDVFERRWEVPVELINVSYRKKKEVE